MSQYRKTIFLQMVEHGFTSISMTYRFPASEGVPLTGMGISLPTHWPNARRISGVNFGFPLPSGVNARHSWPHRYLSSSWFSSPI